MDDFSGQLQEILADPEKMQQIKQIASLLQTDAPSSPPPAAEPVNDPAPAFLQVIGQLSPLLQKMGQEDNSTRLLLALRPILSEPRRPKVDQAIKILKLLRLLPVLRQSGALQTVLSNL